MATFFIIDQDTFDNTDWGAAPYWKIVPGKLEGASTRVSMQLKRLYSIMILFLKNIEQLLKHFRLPRMKTWKIIFHHHPKNKGTL